MYKQLAKQGSTLNKNMTNTDSLSLTDLVCTNASFTTLYMPTSAPTATQTLYVGTTYYNDATKSLRIYDGAHWYQIVLTQVP